MLRVAITSVVMLCHFNEYHSPKCFILNAVALSVIILIVVILSVDMLNVIMVSVVLLIVVEPPFAFSYKLGQFNETGLGPNVIKLFTAVIYECLS